MHSDPTTWLLGAALALAGAASGGCDSKDTPATDAAEERKGKSEDADTSPPRVAKAEGAQARGKPTDAADPKDATPEDGKPGDAKPGDAKPDDAKPDDAKPDDAKPDDPKPGDAKPDEDEPDDAKPSPKPAGFPFGEVRPAYGDRGKMIVDDIHMLGPLDEDIDLVGFLSEKYDYPDGIDKQVDPTDPKFPKEFAIGDEWYVVGAKGLDVGKVVGFGASGGASESHWMIVLGDVPEGDSSLAWPKADGDPSKTAILAKPGKLAPKSPEGSAALEAVRKALPGLLDADATKVMKGKKLRRKHVRIWTPRTPVADTVLVQVNVPIDDEEEGPEAHVAGLLWVDAKGTVTALSKPSFSLDREDVEHFVDLDGDGVDEIVFDRSYYEGSYSFLAAYEKDASGKGAWTTYQLGGDGA